RLEIALLAIGEREPVPGDRERGVEAQRLVVERDRLVVPVVGEVLEAAAVERLGLGVLPARRVGGRYPPFRSSLAFGSLRETCGRLHAEDLLSAAQERLHLAPGLEVAALARELERAAQHARRLGHLAGFEQRAPEVAMRRGVARVARERVAKRVPRLAQAREV